MNIGLNPGAIGSDVERLQRVLTVAGFLIEAAELEARVFGRTTLAALHDLQRRHGIPECDQIDEVTFAALIEIENITININEGTPPTPPAPDEHAGRVDGTLTDENGAPLARMAITLLSLELRSQTPIGHATTDTQGKYTIRYKRSKPLNLAVRAIDDRGDVIATSPTTFAAAAQIVIDFTTASDGVVRGLSQFTKLTAAVTAALNGTPLGDLRENLDTKELTFLASAIQQPLPVVASLFLAHWLGSEHGLKDETFFGIFAEGIPPNLQSALNALPDAGIDDTFAAQILSGVLTHTQSALQQALNAAVAADILPATYSQSEQAELNIINGLRIASVGGTPYVRGKTSLNDLLGAGAVTQDLQTAFVQTLAANSGNLGPTWTALRANKNIPAAELTTLNTVLSAGELLTGNLPLVKDTLQRLSNQSLASLSDLALLDQTDWEARINSVDPDATSIPQVLPNDTAADRIARFALSLTTRFQGRFSTTAFRGGLLKATTSAFTQKEEIVSFLASNATFNLHHTNIDQYLVTNKATIAAPALSELKTAQRLHRVSPHYATVDALLTAGYTSAQSIYLKGRAPFLDLMTNALGSAPLAATAYARAQMTYATSLMALGQYNASFSGIGPVIVNSPQPTPSALENLPDLQALFGSLDYFQCDDCQSVYSPAAYLVDLLQYLSWFKATPLAGMVPPISAVTTALDALLFRRPEIQYVALSCDNTNIVIPYIDLVNEILEAAVAPAGVAPPPSAIETVGTTAERRALPQQTQPVVSAAAYAATNGVVFPITLPFDLDFARTTAYIGALGGTTRSAMLNLFPNLAGASALAGAALNLNAGMQSVVNQPDTTSPWVRWGLAQNPAQVIDPKTNQPYSPNPADWVAALNHVPVLENRAGLTLQQVFQLLEVIWVTQLGVTLQLGFTTEAGIQVLSSSTDDMIFTGLTADVLDRANRFLRLWNASGLQMWELDWALEQAAGGVLDDVFLTFLSGAIGVKTQLNLPLQEALTFWAPLETRDVVSHLSDEDAVVPSTYSEIFMNAAVAANWSSIFVPLSPATLTAATNASPIAITSALANNYQTGMQVSISGAVGNTAANGTFTITVTSPNTFTLNGSTGNGAWTSGGTVVALLSGNTILGPSSAPPTPEQNAITASLGLNAQDIGSILAASGAANTLSLATLGVLVQYQRLASSLSLSVTDLITFIQLTGGTPFNAAPTDTAEFCRRVSVLQATGIAVNDLNYLLRGQAATQSALAFTATQATAVLQTVRDAVAKDVASGAATLTAVTQTTPIGVSTAQPHGLPTGTTNPVFVTGVTGNTAANGLFSITVTSPTSFTLTGSVANAAWTGGGTVVTDVAGLNVAIQTSVIASLVTATNVSSDALSPVLDKTAILPLPIATIQLLLAQSTVDPTQFPTLTAAFTTIAMASALFTALAPSTAAFSFAVANAGTFGWLDPSALPLNPILATPYLAFEALLRALKLQQRQAARSPKLFDVLGAWLTGPVPGDVPTAIGGPAIAVADASNATPIVITTTAAHGLTSGTQVTISGVLGNIAANGTFSINVTGADTFSLLGSIGSGAYTSGGTVESLSAPAMALALNASIPDVETIATALGAQTPSLVPATQPGTLADMAMLTSIAAALDVAIRYGISGSTLVQLATATPDSSTSTAAVGAFQAQYPQTAWLGAVQPTEDHLRQARRDALVAYLLGPGSTTSPGAQFLTTDDIFNYYLIDPEMCACGETTRLLQPSLAIQQFVQQVFLNLTVGVTVDSTDPRWSEWSWRQQYRLWEANREVFLYPENYVLPELRTNASPFFSDLESDLQQSNCDADAVEAAYENYLRKLVSVSRLVVGAHYNQVNGTSDGSTVLWVFARTRGTPPQWYYRTRTTPPASSGNQPTGVWSAWTTMNLDIGTDQLVPVVWDRKLYLIWPTYKQIAEKQGNQSVPANGGGTTAPAPKFWAVQFAMSEFSAGQWQAKRTIDEKMYFDTEDPTSSFTFKAYQDASFNLQIQVYNSDPDNWNGLAWYVADGAMSLPDAPLSVTEVDYLLPESGSIDLTQEPTYSLIGGTNLLYIGPIIIQPTPSFYSFKGQDLVYGGWWNQNTGTVPLYVLSLSTSTGSPGSVEVLGKIANPRIVPPQQEMVFDSADPFFVADNGSRTYLVQPKYYTVGSSPQELDSLTYIKQWTTEYEFHTFYHPYARTFLRELEIGGVSQLLSRNLQLYPQQVRAWPSTFSFQNLYTPTSVVSKPYPGVSNALPGQIGGPDAGETWLDFDPACGGAYSLYNWEIFYHAPMFIASQLMQNNQFQDTMTWLEYIFNPTDSSGGAVPQRFWEFAPFNQMHAQDWADQQIQNLLTKLAADTQQGISDPSTANAITAWMNDPYDPHMVASMRIAAYGKATVMKFLDLLIAWGDSYYAQYTSETVSQAEQLYVLADMILGPQPDQLRIPASQQSVAPTYASLKDLDLFSNVLVNVENVIIAPEPPQSLVDGSSTLPSLPTLPGNGSTLLFCIPPNDQLLAYWGTVAQRLYNIRHCLNQQGVAQPLPLYAPPINPLQLIAEKAEGATSFGGAAAAPIYRFATYLQKAVEFTNDVRSYGAAILSALEKQDAENLGTLRATQELSIQTAMLALKTQQLTEAQDQITVLQNQQAVTQIRYNYYSTIVYMNPWEITALALQGGALIANGIAMVLDLTAGVAYAVPKVTAGASGFGGSPTVTLTYGGENVGNAAVSAASVSRTIAGLLSEGAAMSSTMGSYQRRQDDWTLQANLAQAELTQIASQIVTANDRVAIATTELSIQNTQINNAQAISDFLTNKYTNAQLYNWMLTQLTTVYTQAYQLAYSLALQAQSAYQYELGRPTDIFIQSSYWSSQYKGLTAGDSLLFDLRRMDSQYLTNNLRELELTKHVSLALTQPDALMQLLQSGSCTITLDETLFDHDYPGHYFRRLRSVALTIPCVTGPYTGVHGTLSLGSSVVRTVAPSAPYTSFEWSSGTFPNGVTGSPTVAATPIIATSTGQNDAGLFEVNHRDERWLPFEGQGAVSTWNLTLDPRDNDIDLSTVTDVILHLNYSARAGGDPETVRTALKPINQRTILLSVSNTFSNALYAFFNPADTTATQQQLVLPLLSNVFPFSNLGTPFITDVTMYVAFIQPISSALKSALSGIAMDGTFGPSASATPTSLVLKPVTSVPGGGGAENAPGGGPVTALWADVSMTTPTALGSFTLTLPQTSLPPSLETLVSGQERLDPSQIDDIFLVISYEVK